MSQPVSSQSRIERSWTEPGLSPLRLALWPLSQLYAFGWIAYESIYTLRLKRAAKPHTPILVVGNLVAGGAGKTPVTLCIASHLAALDQPFVIGASGYGSPRAQHASLAPDGPFDPAEWGDEPALLREKLPQIPLIVGRDRVAAAQLAHRHFPGHLLLMDDGFQHLRLATDLQILLDDPQPANRLCLPAGPYRQPRAAGRRKATLVLPSPTFTITPLPPDLVWHPAPPAPGTPLTLLTAIAQPHRVLASLSQLGLTPAATLFLPDHDPLTRSDLLAPIPPDHALICTEKDFVKLKDQPSAQGRTIGVLSRAVTITPEAEFRAWLQTQLNAVRSKATGK